MIRRTALLMTMMLGGVLAQSGLAQSTGRKTTGTGTRTKGTGGKLEPVHNDRAAGQDPEPAADDSADSPPNMPAEPGQQWRHRDISRYTGLDFNPPISSPQNAIVEWIFRRTGTAPWHGDKVAVLSASRTKIRAYNDGKYLDQADEVIERFTQAQSDFLSIRVRFIAAVDTRWRYAVYSRLTPVGSGPQGQQIWTCKVEDSAFVLAQMQIQQGFRLLADQKLEMANGQTMTLITSEPRGFLGGMQRETASGLGFQPKAEKLEEGVTLRLSPLLTFDGDALDAAIDLTANTVKSLHRTKILAPREVGPSEITIDVPEVTESRLNQTVKNWPLGQTLVISAGIQPGILQSKAGFMGLRIPGTVPSGTEMLVFLDAEASARPRRTARRE
jgi:hypothetical protein